MSEREAMQNYVDPAKPRILLAASGSVAASKFANLCHSFSEWAEIRAVATKSALHFIDKESLPKDVLFYTDDDEWSSWKKIRENVLHIELRKWADLMVIAPLSANTLGKVMFIFHLVNLCDSAKVWDSFFPFEFADLHLPMIVEDIREL